MKRFAGFDHATDFKNQLAYAEKEGYKKGRREAKEEILINLLNIEESVETIAEVVNLSVERVEKIRVKLARR